MRRLPVQRRVEPRQPFPEGREPRAERRRQGGQGLRPGRLQHRRPVAVTQDHLGVRLPRPVEEEVVDAPVPGRRRSRSARGPQNFPGARSARLPRTRTDCAPPRSRPAPPRSRRGPFRLPPPSGKRLWELLAGGVPGSGGDGWSRTGRASKAQGRNAGREAIPGAVGPTLDSSREIPGSDRPGRVGGPGSRVQDLWSPSFWGGPEARRLVPGAPWRRPE